MHVPGPGGIGGAVGNVRKVMAGQNLLCTYIPGPGAAVVPMGSVNENDNAINLCTYLGLEVLVEQWEM